MMPTMKPVRSSNIKEVGHQGSVLWVRFTNGQLWHYAGVSEATATEMLAAPSVGTFFARNIKRHHEGVKVEG